MRRALVLLCLFVFIALPQAFASMAYASPSPFQHAALHAASVDCTDTGPDTDLHSGHASGASADSCDAEECDNDPITLYPQFRQAVPFCAIIWQAGPGALVEADVWQAIRPPRVRN